MKKLSAVAPYMHPGFLNFKQAPYEAWWKLGGQIASSHYPWRFLHGLAYRWELPSLWKNNNEAQLRFVEPVSITFDTFPDYARYEIIPFVWDCWPCHFEKMCTWLKRHGVRTAIFTSSQTAEKIRERFPKMNVMYCPEGIDTSKYIEGKPLKERRIDVLEFGRSVLRTKTKTITKRDDINYVCTKEEEKFLFTNEQLVEAMGDAKVTIALPRSVTQPEVAGDIETLTQRYWECMLSRIVMVGRSPKELTELIGYDPVIPIDQTNPIAQIENMLMHIGNYQGMVDRNRETALRLGDWSIRAKQVMDWLKDCGYSI